VRCVVAGDVMAHEFDGKKYEKASAHQKAWGDKLISELALFGNERVLDLGCGDGVNTAKIAERLTDGEVVGIDASRGMIEAARPKEKGNLRFILMDIDEIRFENEFDVIFSNATLHWVGDHRRLLRNVFRALRPGGVLRFNFAADGNCVHFFEVVRRAMQKEDFSSFFSNFTWPWTMPSIAVYTQLADESDFETVKVWGENADRYFPDAGTMIGWIDQPSIVPFMAWLPDSHKTGFRDYVVNEMIRKTRQDDGRCFETFRRVNLYAKKGRHDAKMA
jgi:trans-aconitate 2-methyltransferase